MKVALFLIFLCIHAAENVWAQEPGPSAGGMTLWQILQAGGLVMIILGVLSLVILSLTIYLLVYLDPKKLVPVDVTRKSLQYIEEKKYDMARRNIAGTESIVKNVLLAGLERVPEGEDAVRETVELTARNEVASLWNWLSYISDIAQIAPMLGLLGTVLGMIQAFNTIAFETGVVKPIALAGGVSQAMVTTAGGLVVAIVAMIFYSALRNRVQNITNLLETETSLIIKAFPHDQA